ncbi:hypothetical protein ABZX85_01915 [Streptomyces sp. NPDC004539]|uniref:hypothetical protein n=1 Tax=Streptomyces sp. NPDC004539 TaxID=3154280 RepID=UPI0033B5D9ED
MTYREELRLDRETAAEERRRDAAAAEERRAARQREADERRERLRGQARAERAAVREERRARRSERARSLTPEHVYRRGTLALVVASGLASLPAQVAHFAGISVALLPLPFALEGAAWVMAAGVAYADARRAPVWVRWLLRVLVALCAGFAAWVNYGYGLHLEGLSPADARAAGWGLAAVTLLGPVVFEIRQWVSTLAGLDPAARDMGRHAARRRRHHRAVHRLAGRLVSAAPYGALHAEDAWARAWEVVHGPCVPGMTPDLERRAQRSAVRLAKARTPDAKRTDRNTRPRTPVRTAPPEKDAYAQATPRTAAPRTGERTRAVRSPRTAVPRTDAAVFEEAELERTRQRAEEAYADSVSAGQPIGPAALGREFGFTEGWGRKRIRAVEQRRTNALAA